jgi:hypothetical protein
MRQQIEFIFRALSLILLWRGGWHLMDMYFFPGNPAWSNWGSLILGLIVLLIAEKLLAPKPNQILDPKKCVDCAPQA